MFNATFPEQAMGVRRWGHLALMIFGTVCGGVSAWYSAVELYRAYTAPSNVDLSN